MTEPILVEVPGHLVPLAYAYLALRLLTLANRRWPRLPRWIEREDGNLICRKCRLGEALHHGRLRRCPSLQTVAA